jgi:hypothetical protein
VTRDKVVCGRKAMRAAICCVFLAAGFTTYAQQTAPSPSIDDLEKQLHQKKQEKRSVDDARAAKAAKAAQQARIDAIGAAAQHLKGKWTGDVALTNEPLYWCKVEITHTFTMDLGSLDVNTSKISGYLKHVAHYSSSYYGKTYDGRSASANKRIDSCRNEYNGNKIRDYSVYLRFDAAAQSQRLEYIEESCTGLFCSQQLSRVAFQMTTLANGQAELSVDEGKVRMSHN